MPGGDTIPKRFRGICQKHPETTALMSKDGQGTFESISYKELYRKVKTVAAGLSSLGISRGKHVGIISHNRKEWIMTDLAVLSLGGVDVPRGSDSTMEEIGYILDHSDCSVVFAEDKEQVKKIFSFSGEQGKIKTVVLYDDNLTSADRKKYSERAKLISFQELYGQGEAEFEAQSTRIEEEIEKGEADDLATIIYTSGTTGEPKGVMLTHRNFVFQIERIYDHIHVKPGHVFLTVLPVWHSFERAVEYVVINIGATIAYSKPIGKIMLEDMLKVRPHWMASVPRIWEGVRSAVYRNVNSTGGVKKVLFHFFVTIGEMHTHLLNMVKGLLPQFSKRNRVLDIIIGIIPLIILTPFKLLGKILVFNTLKAKLGGRFIAGISGGGALPPYVDRFFQAVGIGLLEGYGLTETAPILAVRKQHAPVPNTVGPLLPDIEYKVLDEHGKPQKPGEKGVLYVKSDQVMKGYYKKPEVTETVLQDGWLNTGDLAVFTHTGEFKIIGRVKETIVLMGGENIEPAPIEEKLVQSDYIDQVMVVGQDKKFLAALIVPNMEKLESYASQNELQYIDMGELLQNPEIQNVINNEIQSYINSKSGFKSFERIFRFTLLSKPFEVGKELTQTMKLRRDVIDQLYNKEINQLFE